MGEHMVAKHFLEAMEIRAYVEGLKSKANAMSKKAIDLKTKLSKARELLKVANEEMEYF